MKTLVQYIRKNTASITCVKGVLIFRNILPCKGPPPSPFNFFFFTMVFLLLSIFLNIFFLLAFLWVPDIVRAQNYFAFTFTNLIQVEEKALVPVTIRFPDYAFNENIHNMYCFQEWYVSLIHFFMTDTKNKEHVSFESWEKICYVAFAINHAGQLIFLRNSTSLHERYCAGLIDNPSLKNDGGESWANILKSTD